MMRLLLPWILVFLTAASEEAPLLRGEIQALEGVEATVNIGSRDGVVEGMIFRVYGDEKIYRLPFSDDEVVREGRVLAELRVTHVSERFCRGNVPPGTSLKTGLVVLGRPARAQGNQAPKIENVTWDAPAGSWGRELMLEARSSDPDGNEVRLSASASAGDLKPLRPGCWLWHPPKGRGAAHVTIDATDGIARVHESLVLEYNQSGTPIFDATPRVLLGSGRFPFENADRIQVDDEGLLWVLDRNRRLLTALGPSLRQAGLLDLNELDPIAFSVAGGRVAVLDGRESCVHLWDRNLKPLGRVGREGRAVHEWEDAGDVLLLPDATLCVLDAERQTVVVYDASGAFRAAIGHPGNTPPGFLKASALEPSGAGFSVVDLGQHLRHIFDAALSYRESRPLGDNALAILGAGSQTPVRWPEGLTSASSRSLTRAGTGEFLALDPKGGTLLSFTDTVTSERILRWDFRAKGRRLAVGPHGEPHMFDRKTGQCERLDTLGWRRHLPLDLAVDELSDFIPGSPSLQLDSKTCRVIIGELRFGQKGEGVGMMDEPEEILRWGALIAVLDRGNEKVLLFREDGTLDRERPFKGALSFCSDGRGLAVLGEEGVLSRWASPEAEPVSQTLGEGSRIRRIEGGFVRVDDKGISLFDTEWKPLGLLPVDSAMDALQCDTGELWVLSERHGLLIYSAAK